MKEKILVSSSFLTLLVFSVLIASVSIFVISAPTTVLFSVNLSITGNSVPSIAWVQSGISATPTESDTTTVWIAFNVTDANGFADIDYTTAQIVLNKTGETTRTGTCIAYGNSSLTMKLNCSVNMYYYDLNGDWTVNVTVQDLADASAEDTTQTFSYGTLQAVRGNLGGVMFGAVNLGQIANATNDPMYLNNTGNVDFTIINMTAHDLIGQRITSQFIPAGNMTINASADGFGQRLLNNSAVTISGATLNSDDAGVDSNVNLYFFIDVPTTGLSNQNYSSSENWLIEVFP